MDLNHDMHSSGSSQIKDEMDLSDSSYDSIVPEWNNSPRITNRTNDPFRTPVNMGLRKAWGNPFKNAREALGKENIPLMPCDFDVHAESTTSNMDSPTNLFYSQSPNDKEHISASPVFARAAELHHKKRKSFGLEMEKVELDTPLSSQNQPTFTFSMSQESSQGQARRVPIFSKPKFRKPLQKDNLTLMSESNISKIVQKPDEKRKLIELPEMSNENEGKAKKPRKPVTKQLQVSNENEGIMKSTLREMSNENEGKAKKPRKPVTKQLQVSNENEGKAKKPRKPVTKQLQVSNENEGIMKSTLPEMSNENEGKAKKPRKPVAKQLQVSNENEGIMKSTLPEMSNENEGNAKKPVSKHFKVSNEPEGRALMKSILPEVSSENEGNAQKPRNPAAKQLEISNENEGKALIKSVLPKVSNEKESKAKKPRKPITKLPGKANENVGKAKKPLNPVTNQPKKSSDNEDKVKKPLKPTKEKLLHLPNQTPHTQVASESSENSESALITIPAKQKAHIESQDQHVHPEMNVHPEMIQSSNSSDAAVGLSEFIDCELNDEVASGLTENVKLETKPKISNHTRQKLVLSLHQTERPEVNELTQSSNSSEETIYTQKVCQSKSDAPVILPASKGDILKMLENVDEIIWVQCDHCDKWRQIHNVKDPSNDLPNEWNCSMNSAIAYNSCDVAEQKYGKELFVFSPFVMGSVVWAKLPNEPTWPAMIDFDPDNRVYYWFGVDNKLTHYHVTFFGKPVTRGWVLLEHIFHFSGQDTNKLQGDNMNCFNMNCFLRTQFTAAQQMAKEALEMSIENRRKMYSFAIRYKGNWRLSTKKSKSHRGKTVVKFGSESTSFVKAKGKVGSSQSIVDGKIN